MSEQIKIGKLVLEARPSAIEAPFRDGFFNVDIKTPRGLVLGDITLTSAEWSSLQSVARVVEAAGKWNAMMNEPPDSDGSFSDHGPACYELMHAIDTALAAPAKESDE